MSTTNKICCFGELLLRLSPDTNNNNWLSANSMPFYIGGAELNAATALANWSLPVKYITALPDNYLSRQVLQYVAEKKVDGSGSVFSGEGMGIYYLPIGLELKNTSVIYDRANSSFSTLSPGAFNWEKIFEGCSWFHFSAITPALNPGLAGVCLEALKVASAMGLTISIDLNYRSKLWQYGKQPVEVMPGLVAYCDVVMGNAWAVESLLGLPSPLESSAGKSNRQLIDAAAESMLAVQAAYPRAATLAYTYRLDDTYMAVLRKDDAIFVSREYAVQNVVDKVGSGDCFMAGLVYGLYRSEPPQQVIDFASAAAVGKLYEAGDATSQDLSAVHKRMKHDN